MSVLALGLDTGGTFTDAVIIDLETKKIHAEAKSETTHFHLIDGISAAIAGLDFDGFDEVRFASLSTTLATNAIVEGHGGRVGLILMGFEPEKPLPRCELRRVRGSVDLHGDVREPLDEAEVRAAIESLRGKVDAVAVSGILSVRNPEQERQVKAMVREHLDLPCVAAHEFSSDLGMHERTVTAVLNAGLLPIIDELLKAVREALLKRNMDIPIMVVKGDGSLMTESTAKYRPIETILSGPAASIIGATFLRGAGDGLVLDMGGTTTDIAVMRGGRPRIDPDGARVGGWRTRVEAAAVNTFGLGGDSRIWRDGLENKVKIGPRRVYPVSFIADRFPSYLTELKKITMRKIGMLRYEICEGFLLLREGPVRAELSPVQSDVLRALREGPHTLAELSDRVGVDADFINMDALISAGAVAMVGFTPTDLLHCTGEYDRGSREAAEIALTMLARHWDGDEKAAVADLRRLISRRLFESVLESAFTYEGFPADGEGTEELKAIVDRAFHAEDTALLNIPMKLELPIIGIGAPIRAWLPPAAAKFYTEVVFPEHYHVANAVGAAAGKVIRLCRITVENHELDGIFVYAPWGRRVFGARADGEATADDVTSEQMHISNQRKNRAFSVEQAITYAIEEGTRRMKDDLGDEADGYDILVERHDSAVNYVYNENMKMFLESKIEIAAVQKADWSM
ncbi:MAG: hydantoinase/oxoprolinase family protein [Bacillota bacterium]|jgi:N-methylhydantoinase A/oxoprolinase/acetone carboxylase beta subunit